ncbi:MAG: Crp/Fnr family transcriptional regulator [Candidatus Acetothermia bacterium]
MHKEPFRFCESCDADCIFKKKHLRKMVKKMNSANILSYNSDEWVFEAGEPIVGFYIICKGVVREISHHSIGNNITLRLLKPGDILIGDAFLDGQKWYETTAKSLTETTALFLDRTIFSKIVEEADEVITREIANSMKSLRNIIELSSCSVRERTAYWLLMLDEGMSNHFFLTNDELAEIVGCSSVTISKTLSKFKSKGIIYKTRRKMNIKDLRKLKEHADCSGLNGPV